MANPWSESVAEAQRRAKKRLPKGVYGALVAGSERGLTAEDNLAAFAELGFAPHTGRADHDRHRQGLAHDRHGHVPLVGQAGVENVLDLLRDGLGSALVGLGRPSIAELSRDDLVVPPGFERWLGVATIGNALHAVSPAHGSREA
jgi:isopentenyl diphosphate isomerase/L-lactate dehydrogenase-like FMN-dependent dehydrogenase